MKERTLVIVKPDSVGKGCIGEIIARFEKEKFKIIALRMFKLKKEEAMKFYEVHKEKPFYLSLCDFMSSGPCVAMVLEGENAIERTRNIMGVTDPARAEEGTLRKKFGTDIEKNAIHGSDLPENALREIHFFFPEKEL